MAKTGEPKTVADFPELVAQWHPTKNGDVLPSDFSAGSNKKVWWNCAAGPDHVWKTSAAKRTREGQGCPACSGNQVSVTNNLAVSFPDLVGQWHPFKNGDLTAHDVLPGAKDRKH